MPEVLINLIYFELTPGRKALDFVHITIKETNCEATPRVLRYTRERRKFIERILIDGISQTLSHARPFCSFYPATRACRARACIRVDFNIGKARKAIFYAILGKMLALRVRASMKFPFS